MAYILLGLGAIYGFICFVALFTRYPEFVFSFILFIVMVGVGCSIAGSIGLVPALLLLIIFKMR